MKQFIPLIIFVLVIAVLGLSGNGTFFFIAELYDNAVFAFIIFAVIISIITVARKHD